jgi:TolA-binding protein
MSVRTMFRITFLLALTALAAPAQNDPRQELQAIAERVQQQLAEIDRLLLESSNQHEARATPRELLARSVQRSAEVQQGIEELIAKLNELKNQSESSSERPDDQPQPDDQQQQQQQQQQQGGSPQARRESSNSEFVQQPQQGAQPKPEPGQQQQPAQQQPQDGSQQPAKAEQRIGDKPPDDPTGPGSQASGEESWGELQPYLNSLKNRGSPPKVPAKYRKYWKAWLESQQKPGGGG